MSSANYPPIVGGFIEGLLAPFIELIIVVFATAVNSISSASGAINMLWFFALFSIIDLLRNVLLCWLFTQFAKGNVIGNILGIFLFYEAINSVSPEAANYSLALTIILTFSLITGVFITAWRYIGDQN